MRNNALPKLVTALGVVCIATGLSWGFLDGSDFAFRFFSDSFDRFITENVGLFLTTLLVGMILSVVGTLAWTWRFSKAKQLRVAACIFALGLVAFAVAPKNVHGPGMLLVFVALCACALSIALGLMAAVRNQGVTS